MQGRDDGAANLLRQHAAALADAGAAMLVLHDLLGLNAGKPPRFVRDFMDGATGIGHAVRRYVEAVKDGSYPDPERHAY